MQSWPWNREKGLQHVTVPAMEEYPQAASLRFDQWSVARQQETAKESVEMTRSFKVIARLSDGDCELNSLARMPLAWGRDKAATCREMMGRCRRSEVHIHVM